MRIIDHKPVLFEKSAHNIWTDPYIQQQILKDHLGPQSDGASRKQESVLKIVDFILQHTKPQSHLLDLGCGPGLYTSLLADKDYMVTEVLSFLMFSRKELLMTDRKAGIGNMPLAVGSGMKVNIYF